ncbi:MAG TPA: cytochrome c biogenesis protein CcdA [Methyloceanibacter sp.]|nr:cytochrome c biogenesis protein CcdA [Methyloceanibacter sp.]
MTLFVLSYLAGVLTILSPCILPVLPFVFARADRPFLQSGLPLLIGMAVTFAIVASLAAVAGGWAVAVNQYGRGIALVLLALFGLALLFPALSEWLTRPLVALGARLSDAADKRAEEGGSTVLTSGLLGVATGLLWAPCAGPVLGLVLTGAALHGANMQTTLLLLAFAAGAATSLALALLVGGRVFQAMKRSLGAGEWVRRGLGVLVLASVAAIALGLDTGLLTRLSTASTAALEQQLIDRLHPESKPQSTVMTGGPGMMMQAKTEGGETALPVEGAMPPLTGAVEWLNSPPLTREELKGKVVLIDFWTYSCINCLRTIPYVRAWAEKYKDQGLVVIGVHTPEFAFEKVIGNVKDAAADLKIGYPVAIDNDYAIWRAFNNRYWPAHYLVDAEGRIRHHHFGEGSYDVSERVIQQLLAEAGKKDMRAELVAVEAAGAEMRGAIAEMKSPETYVGYERAENFISPGGLVEDAAHVYAAETPRLNEWALVGDWTVGKEHALLNESVGGIVYRFHARDLHLVLAPTDGAPVRFRVTIDGAPPAADHGVDIDETGAGVVTNERLYQLVRQKGDIAERVFEIEFLDPGVQAYAFTFG